MTASLKRRMLGGAAWTLAFRLVSRVLGVVATLIVARNVPQIELGTLGVIVILDAGILAVTGVGFGGAVVQMPEDPTDYVHTAWTGDAVRAVLAYAFEFLIAPYWCAYFHVPEATTALRIYALGQVILGFHSASTVLLMRDLAFARLGIIYTAESLVYCLVAIVGTLVTHSYWSLVAATLTSYVVRVGVSYAVHPYRPRIEFDRPKAKRMFRFVRWTMAYSGADFALEMTDNAVTGRLIGTTALANYRIAYQMAMEGPVLLQWIIARVAFPSIARVQASAELVRKNALGILAFTASTVIPGAVALSALAPRVVDVLFGAQWRGAVTPLRLLGIAAVARSLMEIAPPVLRGLGRSGVDFVLKLVHVVLMCALLVPFGMRWGIPGIAAAVVVAAVVALPIVFTVLAKVVGLRLGDVARVTLPAVASATIASLGFLVRGTFFLDAAGALLFAAAYAILMWAITGIWPRAGLGATRGLGDETN